MEEMKIKKSIKDAAKQDMSVVKLLAKELIQSKKAKNRIHKAKAQINSVNLQLTQQISQAKVMGALQKSSEVMKIMNNLVKMPEIQETMKNLSKEMTKAGVMEEMINDTMDSLEDDDIEEESEEAVNQILDEVLNKALPSVHTKKLETEEEVEDEEEDELQDRLKTLKQ